MTARPTTADRRSTFAKRRAAFSAETTASGKEPESTPSKKPAKNLMRNNCSRPFSFLERVGFFIFPVTLPACSEAPKIPAAAAAAVLYSMQTGRGFALRVFRTIPTEKVPRITVRKSVKLASFLVSSLILVALCNPKRVKKSELFFSDFGPFPFFLPFLHKMR